MLAPARWDSLPVSVANRSTPDEERRAAERIASGAWLPVSSFWDGFPVEGFVSPDVLDAIKDAHDELIGEATAARDAERDATIDLDRLLAEVDRAVDLLESVDAGADAATIDAAIQGAVNILMGRS